MQEEDFFATSNQPSHQAGVVVAKIVATPTATAWSQAYNAGSLFAVLSLVKTKAENEEQPLNLVGKEILSTLEQEYFTLETKNLESIRNAASATYEKIPASFSSNLVVAAIIDNILYLVIGKQGKATIKRGEKLVTVLYKTEGEGLESASGFLVHNDTIVLQTLQFSDLIPNTSLQEAIDDLPPSEIAENLAPKIHETEAGGASAIIISYKERAEKEEDDQEMPQRETANPKSRLSLKLLPFFNPRRLVAGLPKPPFSFFKGIPLTSSKKLLLGLSVMLAVVLALSIFFAVKQRESVKTQALFQEVFARAQKKYDEGQTLSGLNKNLARDDFLAAEKLLKEAKPNFKKDSKEEREINALLGKVQDSLQKSSDVNRVSPQEIDLTKSSFLSIVNEQGSSFFFTYDQKRVLLADNSNILAIDKNSQKKETFLQNEGLWKDIGGLGVFAGNFYLVDKKMGEIYKFTGSQNSRSEYLASGSYDFSSAQDMAIDGAIYVLSDTGTVLKFLKGKPETFNVAGLDKPFLRPLRIFTDPDTDYVYILDKGNSRIVVLEKNGTYKAQYQASILNSASHFEVIEKEKKINVLSNGKLWEIRLK